MADFNCGEVRQKTLNSRGENTGESRLLRLTMNNTMIQWVIYNTRYRGEDKLLEGRKDGKWQERKDEKNEENREEHRKEERKERRKEGRMKR